jgi:hypothetical protein
MPQACLPPRLVCRRMFVFLPMCRVEGFHPDDHFVGRVGFPSMILLRKVDPGSSGGTSSLTFMGMLTTHAFVVGLGIFAC